MSTILLLLLFVLAWVVLILPKQRELRRHNALLATLVEGDEVMSGSGIYGTITAIDGDVVYLEVAPGLELKVARRAVASKVAPAVEEADDDEADETDTVDPSGDGPEVDEVDDNPVVTASDDGTDDASPPAGRS